MAISIVNQWDDTTGTPDTSRSVSPAAGNWLVAVVTWKSVTTAVQPNINYADTSRNLWYLAATKTAQANNTFLTSAGPLNVQVWICPAPVYVGWSAMRVYTAIQTFMGSDQGSVCIKLFEVAGMGNGYLTVDSVTLATVAVANSVTLTVPAPTGGANCLQIAAAASDIAYGSYTTTGTGWAQLDNVVNSNPNVGLHSAWREATTGGSCTFSLAAGFNQNWTAVTVALRTTGVAPSQPNPNWPATEVQLGFGQDLSTPLSAVSWTTVRNTLQALDTKRGIQYELGVAQAEPTDITLRNNDGGLSPRDAGGATATATAAGSTTTFVCSNTDAAGFNVGDFFTLQPAPANPNSGFETGTTTGWTAVGGTLTTTTSVGAVGTYAGQLTPSGSAATVQVKPSSHVPVTPGSAYTFFSWLRCAVTRVVELRAIWYDSGGATLSTNIATINIAANTWTTAAQTLTAPPGAASVDVAPTMTGTPAATNVLYLDSTYVQPTQETTVFKVVSKAVSTSTTVTFAPADGSGGGALRATGAGDLMTGVPVDLYTPYRVLMTWGGKRHVVTAGWAEQWPETWDASGFVGAVTMTGTGTLANLTAANQSVLSGEIMRRNPHSYWPLGDAQGATSAQNLSGRGTASLVVTDSTNGTSGTNSFGVSTQGVEDNTLTPPIVTTLLGDPGNGWQQTGLPAADINAGKGTALVANDSNFPAIANGVTIFLVHSFGPDDFTSYDGTHNPTIAIVRNTDSSAGATGSVIKLAMTTSGTFELSATVWDRTTHSSTTTICSAGGAFSAARTFKVTAIAFNRTTWRVYAGDGALAGSGTCNLADKFSIIDIAGEADSFFNGNMLTGTFAHVALFDRMLTDAEIASIRSAMIGHGGDEYTANRVQRKLDTIASKAARLMGYDGQRVCSIEGTDGSTIADICNIIGGYEDALVFEDAAAAYHYRPPEVYSTQTSRATLGERADLGEIPYQAGVIADYDATYIYNSITASNTVKSEAAWESTTATTEFTAVDSTSVKKYGLRSLNRDTRLNSNTDVTHLTSRLLSRYATRKRRISEITIDPASNPNAWLFCLTVEVGDIVTVMRRPLTAAATSIVCQVLQVAHTNSPGVWKTTLTLQPAP